MSEIHNIKLEILRSGPAHNQLLSPLTPYLVLCGAAGPSTVHLPFEQRQLLSRLERLRYYTGGMPVPPTQREAELRELGEAIGRMFGQVLPFLGELSSARAKKGRFVHLRLSLSAFELALLPFETAIAPDGFPGSGAPLFLQSKIPITLTREIRRGRPLPVEWNRPPRILFISAAPAGLASVPVKGHLIALRRAIDPWVKIRDTEEERLEAVKEILTVLPDATLDQIRQTSMDTEYSHVHILAHGAPYDRAGDQRYGLALCSGKNPGEADVIDGEALGIALTGNRASTSAGRRRPTVLSLATCDSANVHSVLTPGGSIAHELHAAGIPWVFASQFPLWMRSSNIFTEVLYKRLLMGADPRRVLHELRQRLRTACPDTHDWASIVAYATVPWDFEKQVADFRDQQTRERIEILFARLDDLLDTGKIEDPDGKRVSGEIDHLSGLIRRELQSWREEPAAESCPTELADRLGLSAASEKRIGIVYEQTSGKEAESLEAYEKSCDFYGKAVKNAASNPWLITQYLSMLAVAKRLQGGGISGLAERYGHWWNVAKQISRWQLSAAAGKDRAWALGTLVELEMLGVVYGGENFNAEKAGEKIGRYCREMLDICGPQGFPVQSTVRQFDRYAHVWRQDEWDGLAKTALTALGTRP